MKATFVVLLLATVVAGALLAACDGSAETPATETPAAERAQETPTAVPADEAPTPPSGGAGGGGLEGTVVPVTPFASPEAVPADWQTYEQSASDRSAGFSLSHPSAWLIEGGDTTAPGVGLTIVMWSWKEGKPPPASMKIDLFVDPINLSTCEEPDESAPATLAGATGWQIVEVHDPSKTEGLGQVHRLAVDRGGFRYCLTAYFIEGIDEATFQQVLGSFAFTSELP